MAQFKNAASGMHSGPPMLRKPHGALAKSGTPSGLKRGYLFGVSPDPIHPTNAAVVIDNNPPLNGFSLPAGTGIILPAGTMLYQGQYFYGPWTMDPDTLQGGTPVIVDMDTMSIVQILHHTSTYIPSAAETLVGSHSHTGLLDSDGHTMPDPIGSSQLNYNPDPTIAPVISGLTSLTYSDIGKTTFDVSFGFTTDQQNPDWLRSVVLYTVRHGDPVPTAGLTTSHKDLVPNGTGVYTVKLTNLGANDNWDIYATYKDHVGGETPTVIVATTSKPTLSAPIIGSVSGFTYTDAGNLTFDAEITIHADLAASTYEVLLYAVRHGRPAPDANTTIHTKVPSVSSGIYDVKLNNLTANVTGGLDIYMAYRNIHTMAVTAPTLVATTASNPASVPATLAPMPTGIASSGPTITAFSATRTRTTGASQGLAVSFTETDFTALPNWISAIELVVRPNGTTPALHTKTIDPSSSTSGTYADNILGLAGTPHDVGIRYVALNGQKSTTVWPAGGLNVADPDGTMLSATDGTMTYARHNSAVRTAISSTGQLLNVAFPGTGNNSDGSTSGFTNTGSASVQSTVLANGQVVIIEGTFSLASTTADMRILLGSATNGYGLRWATGGGVTIDKIVGGTITSLGGIATITQDTNVHSFKITVLVGATNVIEGSFDAHGPISNTDTALSLTSAAQPFTILDGNNGTSKFWGLSFETNLTHYFSQHPSLRSAIQKVADGNGSFITHSTVFQEHISGMTGTGSVALDGLPDGTTYARVKGTELSTGFVKQLNDGTNVRTAAHVAGAIDMSSHLIGSIWDGTNARTPASITATVLAAGGIDFSSGLHTNKNLDNIADGTTWLRVQGISSGNKVTWKSHLGDTSSDTSTSLVDAGNKRFLHTAMSTGVQSAIDSSGNLLNISWSGIAVGSGGAMSGFLSAGSSSTQAFTLVAGQVISLEGSFKLASTTADVRFLLGSASSAYGLEWTTAGTVRLVKVVSGTTTTLGTITTLTQDTNLHSFKFSITVGATNKAEGSFDASILGPVTDSSLTLTAGTWPFTVVDGNNGTTKVWNLQAYSALPHYSSLHSSAQAVVSATADTNGSFLAHGTVYDAHIASVKLDTISDGTTYSRVKGTELTSGTVKQLNDGTNVRTAANVANAIDASGLVKVANATGTLSRTNTDSSITGAIDSSGNLTNNPFGAVSGVVMNAKGEFQGFTSTFATTDATITFLAVGQPALVQCRMKLTTTGDSYMALGTLPQGRYAIKWSSGGSVDLGYTAPITGTWNVLAHITTLTQDTAWHCFRLSVTKAASGVNLEASFDGYSASPVSGDTNALITGVACPVGISLPSTSCLVTDLDIDSSVPHFAELHPAVGAVISPGGALVTGVVGALALASGAVENAALGPAAVQAQNIFGVTGAGSVSVDNIPDGSTYARLKASEMTSGIVTRLGDGGGTNFRTYANVSNAIDATGLVKVANSTGTLPRTNTDSSITGTIDSSGNLLITPFGSSAVLKKSTGGFGGASGAAVSQQTYPCRLGVPIMLSGTITIGTTGAGPVGIYLGNTTNGYGLEWSTSSSIDLVKYVSSVRTVLQNVTSGFPQDANPHAYTLSLEVVATGPTNSNLSATWDANTTTVVTDGSFNPANASVSILAGGTSGVIQNYAVTYGLTPWQYFNTVPPFNAALTQVSDSNGSYVAHSVIYADQIAWASGTPTGAVSLDSVPDGTTYSRIKATDVTSGHVQKTGATGSFTIKGVGDSSTLSMDTEIADGTTYVRVQKKNITTGNNINTGWGTTRFVDTNGAVGGFSGQVSSSAAYPIVAAFPLTFSAWMTLAGTGGSVFFLIGNETNGVGIRWNSAGAIAPVTIKAGTVTAGSTLATVTRDTAMHWVSVKLTPGATPGSSDVFVIYFDTNTVSTTTVASAVTWGSTASPTFDGGTTAGSTLLYPRVSSNNP